MTKQDKKLIDLTAQPLFDGSTLEEGNVIVSVVLTDELKQMLKMKGINVADVTRTETMPNGRTVPVIYMQCKAEDESELKKLHNKDVNAYLDKEGYKDSIFVGRKRYIPKEVLEKFYGVKENAKEDENGVVHFDKNGKAYVYESPLSYDKMIDDLNKSESKGFEPSAGTGGLESTVCILALDALIEEACVLNPKCGEILKMLYDGLETKEIVKKLGVMKSQAYDLIKKAQSLARDLKQNHGF